MDVSEVTILRVLFGPGEAFACLEAADANNDASVNVSDGIYIFRLMKPSAADITSLYLSHDTVRAYDGARDDRPMMVAEDRDAARFVLDVRSSSTRRRRLPCLDKGRTGPDSWIRAFSGTCVSEPS